ncbi:MAG: ribulose-phosphate 3-epimerase [Omnitrophica bacterium RIFCSPLOWO2_01_FULL_50_24]|nr:MAG: ribulose-phosphate 3-epimerase [Omnitrophica bacterium RIFCSPLOWO2_01_FULL_50_24]
MNQRKVIIAPSILSADFGRLADEIAEVERAGCDWIHVDVMDGRFVPNLTIGPPVIRKIRKVSGLPFDVHLMIEDPIRYVEAFRDAGADYITVHVEASDGVGKTLEKIHAVGAKAGITLRPKTPVSTLEPFLQKVDLVLVMTVEPGFGGQAFMPDMLDKIEWVRTRFSGLISVDGGINLATGGLAVSKGADVLVIGSAIFKESDRKSFLLRLRKSLPSLSR